MPRVARKWTLSEMRHESRETRAGCWLWRRYVRKQGYGQVKVNGATVYAHRFAYGLRYGTIPKGVVVHHLCGQKACVNPAHMVLITQSDHEHIHRPERVSAWQERCLALRTG